MFSFLENDKKKRTATNTYYVLPNFKNYEIVGD